MYKNKNVVRKQFELKTPFQRGFLLNLLIEHKNRENYILAYLLYFEKVK